MFCKYTINNWIIIYLFEKFQQIDKQLIEIDIV